MFDGTVLLHDRPGRHGRLPRLRDAVRLGLLLAVLLGLATLTAAVPALTPGYVQPRPGAAPGDLAGATFLPW